jgi:signal peptidase I
MGSEHVRFNDGNIEIKRAGFSDYIDDQSFRTSLSLVDGPHRSIDANLYNGIKAWGSLFGYQEKGVDMNSVPSYLKSNYALVQNDNYPDDMYAFEMAKNRSKHLFDPSDSSARSASVSMKKASIFRKVLYCRSATIGTTVATADTSVPSPKRKQRAR